MPPVVAFDNVSVRFILEHQRPRSFQDALVGLVHRSPNTSEEFWALQNINFAVGAGETLGIIGQNGSGKSTLLKVVTRILEPTIGSVNVSGKVSALIELGAGFHPDLTGRENIYLNGSIMGFGRKQMNRLFEDIVAFAELERFIDTPVKHYSSGMYLRLGFSVATSVDPDVLIIDEVLSVGDAVFQAKCMERIADFRRRGKTLIFVSHSLSQVEVLCDQVIWLQQGQIRDRGPSHLTVDHYEAEFAREIQLQSSDHPNKGAVHPNGHAVGAPVAENKTAVIHGMRLLDEHGVERSAFEMGETLVVRFEYTASASRQPRFDLAVHGEDNVLIHRTDLSSLRGWNPKVATDGIAEARIERTPLPRGRYIVSLAVRDVTSSASMTWVPAWSHKFEVTNSAPENGNAFLDINWKHLDVENRTELASSTLRA